MKKALFWDFDGTLIHTNESFYDSLNKAMDSFNYKISAEEIKKFLYTACSWYTPEISYVKKTGQKWWDTLFKKFELFYKNNCVAEKDYKIINNAFKTLILDCNNYTLYEDAETVLYKCKKIGYKNYILSNNYPELALVIKGLGLSKYITDYIVSSNIGYEKPRIEIFKHALNISQFPDKCYMIGDNPIADIEGGKAIGIKTLLVHNNCNSTADFKCENLLEVLTILSN